MRTYLVYVAGLLAATKAFTITSPSQGQILDPTQPITFSWTSDSSDPSTFNIVLDDSASGGLTDNVVVATDVSTPQGTYIISTSAARTYGDGFVLKAESTSGDVLATSPSFSLAMGTGFSSTYTGTISGGPASATSIAGATVISGDNSATPTTGAQATASGISDSSTAGSTSSTVGSNSFTTSTVSRSGTSTGTTSSSSPSATTSQNAQPKLGSKTQYAFTAAGLIAGLAALLA